MISISPWRSTKCAGRRTKPAPLSSRRQWGEHRDPGNQRLGEQGSDPAEVRRRPVQETAEHDQQRRHPVGDDQLDDHRDRDPRRFAEVHAGMHGRHQQVAQREDQPVRGERVRDRQPHHEVADHAAGTRAGTR